MRADANLFVRIDRDGRHLLPDREDIEGKFPLTDAQNDVRMKQSGHSAFYAAH